MLRALVMFAILAALCGSVSARSRTEGSLRVGVEDVTLDRFRLGFDNQGRLTDQAVREGKLQQRYQAGITNVNEIDLPNGWILDTESRIDYDTFSDLQITSERYDRVGGFARTTLARPLANDAYLAWETRVDGYLEQFLPDLTGNIAGTALIYERMLKGDAFLKARADIRKGTVGGSVGDDFTEIRGRLEYEHLPPERLQPEVLPFHKEEREHSDWEFVLAHALEMDKSRDLIRLLGDTQMIADLATDPPLPQAWQGGIVRPKVGIRESVFTIGAEVLNRDLERVAGQTNANGLFRAALWLGVEWSLSDFLALQIKDTVAAQDWDFQDAARIRSDRIENHLSFDLSYVKEFTHISFRGGVDSHFLRNFDGFDYNRGYAGIFGSYDPRRRVRISGYLRGSKEKNRDPAGDFPDLDRFDSYASVSYRFPGAGRLQASYLREKVNISGLQSEFDSAYLDETSKISYKRGVFRNVLGEVGYQLKDEVHRVFTQNNRKDSSVFANVEATF